MRFWKKPKKWFVEGREEYRFHTDLEIEDGEELIVYVKHGRRRKTLVKVNAPAKIHVELAWE